MLKFSARSIVAGIKSDPESPAVFLDVLDFLEDVVGRFFNDNAMEHDALFTLAAGANFAWATRPVEGAGRVRTFWWRRWGGLEGVVGDLPGSLAMMTSQSKLQRLEIRQCVVNDGDR